MRIRFKATHSIQQCYSQWVVRYKRLAPMHFCAMHVNALFKGIRKEEVIYFDVTTKRPKHKDYHMFVWNWRDTFYMTTAETRGNFYLTNRPSLTLRKIMKKANTLYVTVYA